MNYKDLLNSNWLARTVIVMWIITAILVISMLTNLDVLINSTLYNYGLQFSSEWANPYWFYLRLSFGFLGVSLGLGISAMILGFYRSRTIIIDANNVPKKQLKIKMRDQVKLIDKKHSPKTKFERKDETNMIISCPNCRKVFGRPMVMLNFEGGKTMLVNVCPYCNHRLGQSDNNEGSNTEFHIRDQDKSENDQRIEHS